ncbi:unnamed protein product, partial [Prunus brigantina]
RVKFPIGLTTIGGQQVNFLLCASAELPITGLKKRNGNSKKDNKMLSFDFCLELQFISSHGRLAERAELRPL